MATNPLDEEPTPTRSEQLATVFGRAKTAVTGSDDTPVRVTVLLVAAVFFVFLADYWTWGTPLAMVCLILLSLSWPNKRR